MIVYFPDGVKGRVQGGGVLVVYFPDGIKGDGPGAVDVLPVVGQAQEVLHHQRRV